MMPGYPMTPSSAAGLRAYMEWAVSVVMGYSPHGSRVPANLQVPRWSWEGLQPAN